MSTFTPTTTRCRCWSRKHNSHVVCVMIPGVGRVDKRVCIYRDNQLAIWNKVREAEILSSRGDFHSADYGKAYAEFTAEELEFIRSDRQEM